MNMIEAKTADLSGSALDWSVGIANGGEQKPYQFADNIEAPFWDAWVFPDGYACTNWSPSKNWAQCGFLIEKYRPDIQTNSDGQIAAYLNNSLSDPEPLAIGRGDTYLIAVCRAIVAAKLGDTVQVPAELVEVVQ